MISTAKLQKIFDICKSYSNFFEKNREYRIPNCLLKKQYLCSEIQKRLLMEHDFISFKLWRQIKNTAIYISESGGCLIKNLRGGIYYPRVWVRKNINGHSHYPMFSLGSHYQECNFYPHRAVALTYLPNHDLFKTQVDHLDGNIFNNNLWNLEWVTEAENHRRAAEARRKKKG